MRIWRPVFLGLFLSLSLYLLPSMAAADGGHGAGGAGRRQNVTSSPSPSEGFLLSWHRLLVACDAVSDDVEHERLKSLRANAGSVKGLAQALVEHTGGLSASGKSRVRSGVTQLSKISEHLHGVADTGNRKLFRSDVKRIARALRLISSQYADGAVPLSAHTLANPSKGHPH